MGVDPEDDWLDDAVWRKANPSLDITVPIDKVRAAAHSARINTAEENSFRQLRLNQWVKQSIRWMPMHLWDKGNTPIDLASLEGRVCYAGLDLASTTDITALVLVFPPRNEAEPYVVVPYFWILEDNIELRVNRDQVPYGQWEREGLLNTIEGNVVHYAAIGAFIEELGTRFDIREIAYERWGAVQMSQNLQDSGFTVVSFGRGFTDMSLASKEFMKLALEGRLHHGGQQSARLDGGQHPHPHHPCREHQTRQAEINREDRRRRGHHHGPGPGHQMRRPRHHRLRLRRARTTRLVIVLAAQCLEVSKHWTKCLTQRTNLRPHTGMIRDPIAPTYRHDP